jgi:hypothetical protein
VRERKRSKTRNFLKWNSDRDRERRNGIGIELNGLDEEKNKKKTKNYSLMVTSLIILTEKGRKDVEEEEGVLFPNFHHSRFKRY